MKTNFLYILMAGLLLNAASCTNTNEKAETALKEIMLLNTAENKDSFYSSLQEFVKQYPEYPQSATLLFQTAEYYVNIPETETAANLYYLYFKNYPDSSIAAHCLFSSALLHEHFNPNKAADLYKKFINTYPDDPRSEDARLNLKYIGKDPEEILEDILKKNQDTVDEQSIN